MSTPTEQVQQTAELFLTTGENCHADVVIFELTNELTPKSQWEPIETIVLQNQWILPTSATVEYESESVVGYITLLSTDEGWVVISAVYSLKDTTPILPGDCQGALSCCWDGYISASRSCDGVAMSKVFHPLCRLTYATPEVQIISSPDFCSIVTDRYSTEVHAPYAKWKDSPQVSARDTLLGISLVTPRLGLVRLKVGHAPCLWTDLLTCARMSEDNRWWIVAKSSSSEPFEIQDE